MGVSAPIVGLSIKLKIWRVRESQKRNKKQPYGKDV